MSKLIKGHRVFPHLVTGIRYKGLTLFGNYVVQIREEHRFSADTKKYRFASEKDAMSFARRVVRAGAFGKKIYNNS